jgi:hypothetical protein
MKRRDQMPPGDHPCGGRPRENAPVRRTLGKSKKLNWALAQAASEGPKLAKLTARGGRMATRGAGDGDAGLSRRRAAASPPSPPSTLWSRSPPLARPYYTHAWDCASRLRVHHASDTPPARPCHTPAIVFLLRVHPI